MSKIKESFSYNAVNRQREGADLTPIARETTDHDTYGNCHDMHVNTWYVKVQPRLFSYAAQEKQQRCVENRHFV